MAVGWIWPVLKKTLQCFCQRIPVALLQLAFPDDQNAPAEALQFSKAGSVTRHIAGDLGAPVAGIGRWHTGAPRAIVAMPEAAMDEDGFVAGWENQVGRAWQALAVEAVAVAHAMQQPAHHHLRSRVS